MKSQMPEIIEALMNELSRHRNPMSIKGPSKCAPTGSRVICNPPVLNTDNDWLVYVPDSLQETAMTFLESRGATHSEKQETYPDGICYRYGDVNPILIWEYDVFYRWVAATYWAAKLNLQDKAERTFLFSALVDQSVPIDSLVL